MSQDIQVFEDSQQTIEPKKKSPGIRPVLRTLQRRVILIIGTAGITTLVGFPLMGGEAPTVYKGNFQLLVEPATSEQQLADPLTLTRSEGQPSDKFFSLDYPTQIRILTSPEILNNITKQIQVRYPRFKVEDLTDKLELERVSNGSSIRDQTKILEVSYKGKDTDQVLFVLQKTAEKYLKYSLDERKTRISQGVEFIDEQLPLLQKRVAEDRGKLQKIQQQYELLDPMARGQTLYDQIRTLETQSQEAERQLQELRALYQHLQTQLSFSPDEAVAASALSESPFRKQILDALMTVETQIAIQSATFSANSPEVQQLKEQQANLLKLLEQENQKILGENASKVQNNSSVMAFQTSIRQKLIGQLVDTDSQIKSLEVRLKGLNNALNTLTQQAQLFPGVAREYNEIQQQLDLTNKRLNLFLDEREKLRIEAAQTNIPWEIISKPRILYDSNGIPIGAEPESPVKNLIITLGGGIVLGIGLSILLERLRNIFYTKQDIEDMISFPLLGEIPRHNNFPIASHLPLENNLSPSGLTKSRIRALEKMTQFLNAFDNAYANLRFLYADSLIRSIGICSAESKDGKSTIALHLAQTMAHMGQQVLLVDANLRYPQLHTVLGVSNQKGLSDLLTEKATPNAVIQRTSLSENLFILTAGVPYANTFKLLASDQMRHVVESLQETYDLVIYDTPELHEYNDAIFLAEYLDGLILVTAIHKTHKTVFRKILDKLDTYRMPCIGVIANHLQLNSSITYPFYLTQSLNSAESVLVNDSVISNQYKS